MEPDRKNAVLIAASIVFAALAVVAALFYLHYARG